MKNCVFDFSNDNPLTGSLCELLSAELAWGIIILISFATPQQVNQVHLSTLCSYGFMYKTRKISLVGFHSCHDRVFCLIEKTKQPETL